MVDSWVRPKSGPIQDDFKVSVVNVLLRMPKEAVDYLIEGRILRFYMPYAPAFTFRASTNHHLIYIEPEWFAQAGRAKQVYAIAHELAHVYNDYPAGYPEEQSELEADKLVVQWGFEEELRACPENCLYGYGLDRFRVECGM